MVVTITISESFSVPRGWINHHVLVCKHYDFAKREARLVYSYDPGGKW